MMATGSVEIRLLIGKSFEPAMFFDTGAQGDYVAELLKRRFRHSAGGGLRYLTPIGPAGLVYGFKLPYEGNRAPGRFHFTLGYTF
jgi:outer membrane protein insertion porin family